MVSLTSALSYIPALLNASKDLNPSAGKRVQKISPVHSSVGVEHLRRRKDGRVGIGIPIVHLEDRPSGNYYALHYAKRQKQKRLIEETFVMPNFCFGT
jgi:hypothetical protein